MSVANPIGNILGGGNGGLVNINVGPATNHGILDENDPSPDTEINELSTNFNNTSLQANSIISQNNEASSQPNIAHDPNSSFVTDFSDGYSLRTLFTFLAKSNISTGTLIFREEGIYYSNKNENGTVITMFRIFTDQLIRHEFSSQTGVSLVSVELDDLNKPLSKTKKTAGIRFYKTGERGTIYYQQFIDRTNINADSVGIIRTVPNPTIYVFDEPTYNTKRANCVIDTSDICNLITKMKSNGADKIRLYLFPCGMNITCLDNRGSMIHTSNFGDVDNFDDNPTPSMSKLPMSISRNTLKSTIIQTVARPRNLVESFYLDPKLFETFALFNNINPRGVVKIHSEINKPLKMTTSIGDYGQLVIYIRRAA